MGLIKELDELLREYENVSFQAGVNACKKEIQKTKARILERLREVEDETEDPADVDADMSFYRCGDVKKIINEELGGE
jgi:hypothetical protein